MTEDERSAIAREAAERAREHALSEADSRYARNGFRLWTKLGGSAVIGMMVPMSAGLVGYGELNSSAETALAQSRQNLEDLREVQGTLEGVDHRLSTVEGRAGSLRADLSKLEEKLDELDSSAVERHQELMRELADEQ